jgi:hypothetical protein
VSFVGLSRFIVVVVVRRIVPLLFVVITNYLWVLLRSSLYSRGVNLTPISPPLPSKVLSSQFLAFAVLNNTLRRRYQ